MDRVLANELNEVIENSIDFDQISGKSILITGATGYIGSMLVKTLLFCNEIMGTDIRIIATTRSLYKGKETFQEFNTSNYFRLITWDILDSILLVDEKVDYIIHTASETKSRSMIEKPVETIFTSILGTKSVLDLAKEKKCKTVLFISSMEMYGTFTKNSSVTENMSGYLNPLIIRNNYPESKRMCENICMAYNSEYGVPIKIARLAQTFGVGVLPTENRVFAQFARCIVDKKNIVLRTSGRSDGNYVYIMEAIEALFTILFKGKNGEAYNVVNEECHTSIIDMAEMVAEKYGKGYTKVVFDDIDSDKCGYPAETHIRLSASKLRNLGWIPKVGLEEAYGRMIEYMLRTETNGKEYTS